MNRFPYDYNISFQDIALSNDISKALGHVYLDQTQKIELRSSLKGIIYGMNCRPMVSLPVTLAYKNETKKYRWAHFIIDSGAPVTLF